MKTLAEIQFIKSWKTENIIPAIVKVKLSLKHSNYKLKLHIARLVMEAEMQNKHLGRKNYRKR